MVGTNLRGNKASINNNKLLGYIRYLLMLINQYFIECFYN